MHNVLQEKLDLLPNSPGVYLFRDMESRVLYIGKARSLRSRVRSYFLPGSGDQRYFVARLANEVVDLETVVVGTEREAALLENTLIKEHKPRYNVKLRDDKDYLSLRLKLNAVWPRLEVVRRPKADGALYFGPYHSATSARQTLRLVNRHFQLRTCTDADMKSRTRPCLQYQIKRCQAPCVMDVDPDVYSQQVQDVALFLQGRHDELIEHLTKRMKAASERMAFEQAAMLRDQLYAVERVREEQHVAAVRDLDQDVIGVFRQADQAEIAVLCIRGGKLSNVRTFEFSHVALPEDELVASFIREFYDRTAFMPEEVVLPVTVEAMEGFAEALSEKRGRRVRVVVPKRGERTKLLRMAMENAEHAFREKARVREDVEERLTRLMHRLRLPRLPRRIECVDISHTQGADTVASIVALADGAPDRKRYRSFHVRRAAAGDDYGAMYEVLARRFRRGRDGEVGWEPPDLLVVDGGKGQLNVALTALRDLRVEGVPVVSLAKEKTFASGDEVVDRVYLPGQKNPLPVREGGSAMQFLTLARDEAHRAANLLRTKRNRAQNLRSILDDIEGVGPKTRTRLLRSFGSVEGLRSASVDALVQAGANRSQALTIHQAFHVTDAAQHVPSIETEDAELAAIENAFSGDAS